VTWGLRQQAGQAAGSLPPVAQRSGTTVAQGSGDNSSRCGEPWAEKNQYFLLQGGLFLVIF